jgi:hypothetical protein
MEQSMKDLTVRSDKEAGLIFIEQSSDDPGNESDPVIILVREQVVPLNEWLQQALSDLDD